MYLTGCVSVTGSTKREPTVVGKPAEFMLANIANTFGLKRSQICMVGDRLDTDILFGQQGGLSTVLVLSGNHYDSLHQRFAGSNPEGTCSFLPPCSCSQVTTMTRSTNCSLPAATSRVHFMYGANQEPWQPSLSLCFA